MNSWRTDKRACGETLSKNRWLSFPLKWGRVNKGLSTGATHPFRETLKAPLSCPCLLYWQWWQWNKNQCSMINILGKETPWGYIFLSLFLKICFLKEYFYRKIEREKFSIYSLPLTCTTSHIINIPHQSGAFVTTGEPTLTGRDPPRSIIALKVPS